VFEANSPYHRSMTKLVPEWIWRQILRSNSSAAFDWKPRATILGGADPAAIPSQQPRTNKDNNVDLAAAGDLKCEGVCSSGGSRGTTGMYKMKGRILCSDCAAKERGVEGLPGAEKARILAPYLLGGP
jgi:hypothetical protein